MADELVLVTGASGFLGTHVVKTLQEAGCKVRGTVRSTKNEAKVKHLYTLCPGATHRLELVEADLTKEDGWDQAVSGCTYVHHVASPFVISNVKHEDDVIKPAVDGTLVVLRACAKAGTVKKVILTSSVISVINKGGNTKPATEDDWADLDLPNISPYNKSKILAERAAWDFLEHLPASEKFELAVVNPSLILGPALHNTPGASTDIIRRAMEKEIPLIPKIFFNIIDVRDVALAHLKCQTVPEAAGHRHLLESKSLPLKDVCLTLNKEFRQYGYDIPTRDLPGPLFTMASWFDQSLKLAKSVSSQPTQLDCSRMKQVLGICPRDWEQTLIDMAYSLIDQGFVKRSAKYKPRTG